MDRDLLRVKRGTSVKGLGVVLLAGFLLPSCGTEDPVSLPTGVPFDMVLSDSVMVFVSVGDTLRLTPRITEEDGRQIGADVTWSTSDARTATVADGLVTASGPGDATILAAVADLERTARVKVIPDGQSVTAYVSSREAGHVLAIDVRARRTQSHWTPPAHWRSRGIGPWPT
jgi:hypothetical protein